MMTFKQFIQETNLDEKLEGGDKWWYDTRVNKVVKVVGNFHIDQVEREPKKFGLTEKDLDAGSPNNMLVDKGWVLITWSRRINELVLRAKDVKALQKTLNWFLDKVNPKPDIVRLAGRTLPKSIQNTNLQGNQIGEFAKTGRVIKQTDIGRTMARFR